MTLDQVCELWRELKRYVSDVEVEDAADTLIHFMIDNNISVEEIMESFKNDRHVRTALAEYNDDDLDLDEEEFYDE